MGSLSLTPVGLFGLTTIWKIWSYAGAQAFRSIEEKKWRWYNSLERENSSVDMDLVASLKAVAVLACVRGVVRILTFILSEGRVYNADAELILNSQSQIK